MPTWLSSLLLPLIGLAVGAGLQYVFTRRATLEKHHLETRTTAYADYLRAFAEIEIRVSHGQEGLDATIAFLDAKSRMVVYGREDIVASAAEFHRRWRADEERGTTFISMCQAMRADGLAEGAVADADIAALVWQARDEKFAPGPLARKH